MRRNRYRGIPHRTSSKHVAQASLMTQPHMPPIEVLSHPYLFRMAWRLARSAAERFGGSARQHFGSSLKAAWQEFHANSSMQEAHRVEVAATSMHHAPVLGTGSEQMAEAAQKMRERLGGDYQKAW